MIRRNTPCRRVTDFSINARNSCGPAALGLVVFCSNQYVSFVKSLVKILRNDMRLVSKFRNDNYPKDFPIYLHFLGRGIDRRVTVNVNELVELRGIKASQFFESHSSIDKTFWGLFYAPNDEATPGICNCDYIFCYLRFRFLFAFQVDFFFVVQVRPFSTCFDKVNQIRFRLKSS